MDNQYLLTYACIHFALAIKLVISFDSKGFRILNVFIMCVPYTIYASSVFHNQDNQVL